MVQTANGVVLMPEQKTMAWNSSALVDLRHLFTWMHNRVGIVTKGVHSVVLTR